MSDEEPTTNDMVAGRSEQEQQHVMHIKNRPQTPETILY
jgi:hypothetical protein